MCSRAFRFAPAGAALAFALALAGAGPAVAFEADATATPAPVAAPAASATAAATAAPPALPEAAVGPQTGRPAPAFSVVRLDGKTLGLDAYRGKVLVLNVWATWCPPCREEMPALIAAATKFAKGGQVTFLGVDTTESAPIVRAYAAAKNVPYALAIDGDRSFEKAYAIDGFPTTFVIDRAGIVRALYVDVLGTRQLAQLVAAAQAGRNASIVSPLQAKIDSVLNDPKIDFSSTDPVAVVAAAKSAASAIDKAEGLLDRSDASRGMATDFVRTRSEEANLRDKAIVALVAVGASAPTRTLLPRLRGDAAVDRERWSDACDAYRAVLAQEPKDSAALGGLAYASSRLERYDDAVAAYAQLAALDPDDATALVDLARAQAKDGHAALAYGTFAKAVALAKRHVDASPRKASAVRTIAWVHLYAGRTYAANGEPGHARDQFERMLAWTKRLPPNDERHDMYLEEGQEAIAALALGSRAGFSVSLAPWTGAELPGSIPHTLKYRLIVAGRPGRNVRLAASRVPRYWVASFCSDRVCAPGRVGISLPQSGVKIVEFQLVPPHGSALAPKVRVTGTDGTSQASGTT